MICSWYWWQNKNWKDENSSDSPISEFVGLRAKLYSISSAKSNKIKAKGISKSYKINKLWHETFLNVLRSKVPTNAKFCRFQSANHVLKTVPVDKLCLSPFDCRHYILPHGIRTLAFGHRRLTLHWFIICCCIFFSFVLCVNIVLIFTICSMHVVVYIIFSLHLSELFLTLVMI